MAIRLTWQVACLAGLEGHACARLSRPSRGCGHDEHAARCRHAHAACTQWQTCKQNIKACIARQALQKGGAGGREEISAAGFTVTGRQKGHWKVRERANAHARARECQRRQTRGCLLASPLGGRGPLGFRVKGQTSQKGPDAWALGTRGRGHDSELVVCACVLTNH